MLQKERGCRTIYRISLGRCSGSSASLQAGVLTGFIVQAVVHDCVLLLDDQPRQAPAAQPHPARPLQLHGAPAAAASCTEVHATVCGIMSATTATNALRHACTQACLHKDAGVRELVRQDQMGKLTSSCRRRRQTLAQEGGCQLVRAGIQRQGPPHTVRQSVGCGRKSLSRILLRWVIRYRYALLQMRKICKL